MRGAIREIVLVENVLPEENAETDLDPEEEVHVNEGALVRDRCLPTEEEIRLTDILGRDCMVDGGREWRVESGEEWRQRVERTAKVDLNATK